MHPGRDGQHFRSDPSDRMNALRSDFTDDIGVSETVELRDIVERLLVDPRAVFQVHKRYVRLVLWVHDN